MKYQQYSLTEDAERVLSYINNMTDRAYDYLPFWLVVPHKKPAEAEHCKVDDAELVGSWFEAVDSLRDILGESEITRELYTGFRGQLMDSWGEHGLRFHKKHPWTHTIHSSFHEMGYILPALNRLVKNDPEDKEAEARAAGLVRGMRSLVIERKIRSFWSGDSVENIPLYEFPNDIYVKDRGFDFSHHTGRGEQAIRNAVSMHALVDRYVIAGDEVALDLAIGLANHLLGPSRYFNYKMEFFGHVHSSVWIAAGLVYLGRVIGEEKFINAGRGIYSYVKSLSSSFGWVPEFAQWKPQSEEHCETCVLKDMILCCEELIKCGYDEYWNDMNLIARNQLTENQVKYTGYVVSDDSLPDGNGKTYHHLAERIIGGYTGGSEPGSISINRFRSIAGCCVGTAPIALGILWKNAVTEDNGKLTVNIHTEKHTEEYSLTHRMPDDGSISLEVKKSCRAGFRIYPWMGSEVTVTVDGAEREAIYENGGIYADLAAGETLTLTFPINTEVKKEFFAGREYTEYWRGGDLIDLEPRGDHIRLYQRDNDAPKYYPTPDDVTFTGTSDRGPTQMSPNM